MMLQLTAGVSDALARGWIGDLAEFLTGPWMAPLLLAMGFLLMTVELLATGFGVAGTGSVVCFFLYFGAHYITGDATVLSIGLFVVGLIALIAEAMAPGFGIFGIIGIGLTVGGIIASAASLTSALYSLVAILVVLMIAGALVVKYGDRNKLLKRFILSDDVKDETAEAQRAQYRENLLGQTGTALTPLHPAGIVVLEEGQIDAVTEGGFIERGEQVRIIRMDGNRIVVQRV